MFKRPLPYVSSWVITALIGVITGGVVAFILIFLQPLDTFQHEMTYKNLKLAGYGLCMLFSALLVHLPEQMFYKQQKAQWFLWNEIFTLSVGMWLMMSAAYLYNVFVINHMQPSIGNWLDFCWYIALPYLMFPCLFLFGYI